MEPVLRAAEDQERNQSRGAAAGPSIGADGSAETDAEEKVPKSRRRRADEKRVWGKLEPLNCRDASAEARRRP